MARWATNEREDHSSWITNKQYDSRILSSTGVSGVLPYMLLFFLFLSSRSRHAHMAIGPVAVAHTWAYISRFRKKKIPQRKKKKKNVCIFSSSFICACRWYFSSLLSRHGHACFSPILIELILPEIVSRSILSWWASTRLVSFNTRWRSFRAGNESRLPMPFTPNYGDASPCSI